MAASTAVGARTSSTWRERLFTFPDPVNEISARLVAGAVALLALIALALDQHWILVPLAYGFIARALTGPTLSPLGQLVTRVLTPRLGAAPRYVPGPPKRFAQTMGAVLTTAGAVMSLGLGWETAGSAILGLMVVFATLESVFAFCFGCTMFGWLMKVGVIPQEICDRCADISLARPSLG